MKRNKKKENRSLSSTMSTKLYFSLLLYCFVSAQSPLLYVLYIFIQCRCVFSTIQLNKCVTSLIWFLRSVCCCAFGDLNSVIYRFGNNNNTYQKQNDKKRKKKKKIHKKKNKNKVKWKIRAHYNHFLDTVSNWCCANNIIVSYL